MRIYQNLFAVLLVAVSSLTFAQSKTARLPVNQETGLITYEKVQEIPGADQAELYRRGLAWCMSYFKNPNDVIRERDSSGGTITCKARFKIMNPADKKGIETDAGLVQYTLNLMFKDGRYRYVLSEINWKQQSYYAIEKWMDTSNQYYKPEFEYYLQQTDDKIKDLLKDLDKGMKAAEKPKAKDW